MPGACGSVRGRKIPKVTPRNEHKNWLAPVLVFCSTAIHATGQAWWTMARNIGPAGPLAFAPGRRSPFRSGCRQTYCLCLCRRHRSDLVWFGVERLPRLMAGLGFLPFPRMADLQPESVRCGRAKLAVNIRPPPLPGIDRIRPRDLTSTECARSPQMRSWAAPFSRKRSPACFGRLL